MKKNIIIFLSCIGIISTVNINAQIIYTDITDTVINYPTIEYLGAGVNILDVDLNNDSIIDFYFELSKSQEWETPSSQPFSYQSRIYCLDENKTNYYITSFESAPCTYILDYTDIIDQNIDWTTYDYSLIYYHTWIHTIHCGNPFQDKYYGLKFYISDNIHYGWLHLDVNEMGEIVLKGYAYNSIPDQSIKAGQTDLSITEETNEVSQLIISSKNKIVTIKQLNNNELINKVLIYSISGTIISESTVNDIQTSINLSEMKYGIYIVKVVFDNRVISKLVPIN